MSAFGDALRKREALREHIPAYVSSQTDFHALCESQLSIYTVAYLHGQADIES